MRREITWGATAIARVAALGVTAVIAVTACTRAPARPTAITPAAQVHVPGPTSGSAPLAHALAVRMLGGFGVPAGARPISPHPIPRSLTPPLWAASADSADVLHVYRLPMSMTAAYAYVLAHRPAGYRSVSTGTASGPGGITGKFVSYSLTSPPRWVRNAQLAMAIVPDSAGGSLLRADAQVLWFPPRSAAEYVSPTAYRQLRVSASFMNPKPVTFSKLITAPAEIARLATLLDSLHAGGQETMSCPAIDATYRLTFQDSVAGQPVVQASMTVCLTVSVTVGGKLQPALWNSAPLIARVRHLLAIPAHYR